MKHQQIDSIFLIPYEGLLVAVQSTNGEGYNSGPSWSHGTTHLVHPDTKQLITHCGIDWFEKHAEEILWLLEYSNTKSGD